MTVVPFSAETMASDSGAEPLDITADELKARRAEIAVMEARCGEDAPQPEATGWQRWLFPAAAVLLALGFALALPESSLAERSFAASALSAWTTTTAGRSVRAMRLALALRIQGSRRQMNAAGLCAIQVIGIVALVRLLAPEIVASIALFTGVGIAAVSGWQSGRVDPRTERMREDLQEARADLFKAETAFEQELEEARIAFDADMERAREIAGLRVPESVAAE